MNVCSPDTVLRGGKELSCPSELIENPSTGVTHEFSINIKPNDLMVEGLIQTGQLETNKKYDLDYDNLVLPNENYDSRKTYKLTTGHQPGLATIGNNIVCIEGRNGKSKAKYKQDETIGRAFGESLHQSSKIGHPASVRSVIIGHTQIFFWRGFCRGRCKGIRTIKLPIANPQK